METTKLRYRALALFALAFGPAACGRGCGCVDGEKTYETLDGKVKVSLLRKVHRGGNIPGPATQFFVHVDTKPPFDEPVHYDCTHIDMAEDEAGTNVAFRCKKMKEGKEPDEAKHAWTVLRLRGGDRRLRECEAPVGTGSKPEFDKLEPVRISAKRIVGCGNNFGPDVFGDVTRAVLEDEGANAAADLVTELANSSPVVREGESDQGDPWESALARLDAPGQARVLATLCAALSQKDPATVRRYVRAAMHCPLEGNAVADGALRMLRALVPSVANAENDEPEPLAAVLWSGLLAASAHPTEVGAAVCKAAHDMRSIFDDQRKLTFALLIGRTHTRCETVKNWIGTPCSDDLDCDGGLCSERDLDRELEGWNRDVIDGGRPTPKVPSSDRVFLSAAYGQGPLPDQVTVGNRRRRYTFVESAGPLPKCDDETLDAGAPCDCQRRSKTRACSAEPDASVVRDGYCAIHIDDAHERLDDVRRACERVGAGCNSVNLRCCPGMECKGRTRFTDWGNCAEMPPVPDAAANH